MGVHAAGWRAVGLLLLGPTVAWAQGNSVLLGTVTDANTRAPLQNVVVTATSPALQGDQRAVTDDTGEYRTPQLPRGVLQSRPGDARHPEIGYLLSFFGAGRGAYTDDNGQAHDVGVCFFSEPYPSLRPAGSLLSTPGPCVVGPGSNPH